MTSPAQQPIDHIVQCYGDLLFDLCESVLWSPLTAQIAFRSILKEARRSRGSSSEAYAQYERAWILRVACEKLKGLSARHGRKLTAAEQIELNSNPSIPVRLKQFDHYFHRLAVEDKILILLRDKYGLPYPEIAAAMGAPEGSLKVRRSQALRALEEWIWDQ